MLVSRKTSYRLLFNVAIACLLGMLIAVSAAFAAPGKLQRIRCHRYEEGGIPVKIRLSLDFTGKPEKLVVLETKNPFDGVKPGFLKDLTIAAEIGSSIGAVGACPIVYGNAEGSLDITFVGNEIHLAVLKGYQLMKSEFNYIDESNVAYVDLSLKPRTVMPTPAAAVAKMDTLRIEKVVHDTVYIKLPPQVIRDTVFVDKIVYLDESKVNMLKSIKCSQMVSWWKAPQYKIDFKFSKEAQPLTIKEYQQKLPDMPEGFHVRYVILSDEEKLPLLIGDVHIDYGTGSEKIRLMPVDDKCYLLFKEGIELTSHPFTSDWGKKQACLRLD